jgi:plasmid stabilization system protein ParE
MRLRFTARAFRDLDDISRFIRERNPYAAARVSTAILESLNMLTHFPMLGRPQSVTGVRKVVTRRYRYLAYYRVDETANEVIILTIQHPARDREYGDA